MRKRWRRSSHWSAHGGRGERRVKASKVFLAGDARGGGAIVGLRSVQVEDKSSRAGVLFVADGGRDAIKLQSNTGGTGPSVGRRGVTFDFPSAAAFTRSHHLEALVAILLVDKHESLLIFPRRLGGRRKVEVLHLHGLR